MDSVQNWLKITKINKHMMKAWGHHGRKVRKKKPKTDEDKISDLNHVNNDTRTIPEVKTEKTGNRGEIWSFTSWKDMAYKIIECEWIERWNLNESIQINNGAWMTKWDLVPWKKN